MTDSVSSAAPPSAGPPLVRMSGITKSFGGVLALDGVDFEISHGGVHAILGENGAGKSTLMKVLAGAQLADSGSIAMDGIELSLRNPSDAVRAGIVTIYQELLLCPNLSAAANVFLGQERTRGRAFLNEEEMNRVAAQRLLNLGLEIDVSRPVSMLSVAQQQLIEIARALERNGRVLVMDEPTAPLTDPEIDELFRVIDLVVSRGCSVVYISHRLEEIFRISNYVTVMRDGRVVEELATRDATEAGLIRAMVGRDVTITQRSERYQDAGRQPILDVKGLSRIRGFDSVTFAVRPGEVVGIAGIVGAGRTELLRGIFGLDPVDSGTVSVNGTPLAGHSPRQAIQAGVAMTTEDRKRDGLFPNFRVRENLSIASLQSVSRLSWVRRRGEKAAASDMTDELAVKPRDPEVMVLGLSGGNQQKVTIGRCLLTQPQVLLLDEPTRGVDVGAKAEIRRLIRELADQGRGVVMVSSEIPELLATADRILVMKDGRMVADLVTADTNQEEIMTFAAGDVLDGEPGYE